MRIVTIGALGALLLSGCQADTASPVIADHFDLVQGGAQTGSPTWTLDSIVVVRLVDDHGAPMTGVPVAWTVVDGGGTLLSPSTVTGPDGLASTAWTLGSGVEAQHIQITTSLGPTRTVAGQVDAFHAVKVDVGFSYACGLDAQGAAFCWGSTGVVGLDSAGTFGQSDRPVPVAGGHIFVDVSVGENFACGLTASGESWCWGANWGNSLGRPGLASAVPVQVLGLPAVRTISAGGEHACAIAVADSAAWCWGNNRLGQSGQSLLQSTTAAAQVGGAVQFVKVTGGTNHTCGIAVDGKVYCWGDDNYYQLGLPGRSATTAPSLAVALPATALELSLGERHTCARLSDGTSWCWGANGLGDQGRPGEPDSPTPTPLPVAGVLGASAGAEYTMITTFGGRGQYLGYWSDGTDELGIGSFHFKSLVADYSFCGLLADGAVVCSGDMFTGAWDALPPFGAVSRVVPLPRPTS